MPHTVCNVKLTMCMPARHARRRPPPYSPGTRKGVERLHAMYLALDTDQNGALSRGEMARLLDDPRAQRAPSATADALAAKANKMFTTLDANRDGIVTVQEYIGREHAELMAGVNYEGVAGDARTPRRSDTPTRRALDRGPDLADHPRERGWQVTLAAVIVFSVSLYVGGMVFRFW